MLRLEMRPQVSPVWSIASPLLALAITVVLGATLFLALGKDPVRGLQMFFWEPVKSGYALGELMVKATPLLLIALGLAVCFRSNVWNIGAEGQYIIGALTGAGVALALYPLEAWWLFPCMVLAGALGGWAWAMIPGLLKTRFGANEILVSLMLVYVAEKLLAAMALGLMKNPEGYGFPGSRNLQQYPSATSWIDQNAGLHWGVLMALGAVIAAYVLLSRHILGFQIQLAGQAPRAARFAGVNPTRLTLFCLGTSGALAGLAGLFEVSGPAGVVSIDFNAGYGFTAIIVAFLGRLNPWGILLAGLLMALTYVGGDIAQSKLGLPKAAIQMFQGMLLFFLLAVDLFTNYRLKWAMKERV